MDERIEDRAGAWGVETGYEDFKEEWHDTPIETIERVLETMGAESDAPPPSPVTIVRSGDGSPVEAVEVWTEDGGSVKVVGGRLPRDLPPGYHRLVDRDGSTRDLIVSPGHCFLPDDLYEWGWGIQLHSLLSNESWGIGDLADLGRFGRWSARTGAGMTMLNPLHAPNPGPEPQPSPYFPSSRCFRNPLYLAIEKIPGASEADVDIERLRKESAELGPEDRIDRAGVWSLKLEALEMLWERRTPDPQRIGGKADPLATTHATYVTLAERHGADHREWPSGFERPDSPAVAAFRREHEDRIAFHRWVQDVLDDQVATAADENPLIHDLAVGVDPAGADAWMFGDVFARDVKVGAPPDEFNTKGQDWGVLAFDPWRLRATGYRAFIETVRASLRHAGGVRVDHVMGLWRLYWVLADGDPSTGAYVRYPNRDLLDILALESHRAGAYVIGEDLGTVEPSVRDEMARRKMLSYRIMWFEDDHPRSYPELALAAITNHDLPTVTGVVTGADLEIQRELEMAPDEDSESQVKERALAVAGVDDDSDVDGIRDGLYEALAQAPCRLVAATLEDALGVAARPNYPGTMAETNWSVPLPERLEDLESHPGVLAVVEALSTRKRGGGGG